MGDEPEATLDGQFNGFARLFDHQRTGETITLYRSDYWMRQAKLLDDRKLTMTDTGIAFNKFSKTELDWEEWNEFLTDVCEAVGLDEAVVKDTLTNCGLPDTSYCNAIYDSYLCWPPTPAGEISSQHCPKARLSDTRKLAFRRCSENGHWVAKDGSEGDAIGWTNFSSCFPLEARNLLHIDFTKEMLDIAQNTRYLEIGGFCISFVALAISFFIFCHFRSLRNDRTRIHKSLFGAMMVQVIIRLIIYVDQAIERMSNCYTGIENVPFLCKSLYCILEYAVTVMFTWMLIECVYLHKMVTSSALRTSANFPKYYIIGWGLPIVQTGFWAILTTYSYQKDTTTSCWFGYNFQSMYWILQVPRIAVMLANALFLLIILHDLILKLRDCANSETQITWKATRAALMLLPLLGITNWFNLIAAPTDGLLWKFALWSYGTYFLRSFQGFFIALIYCFTNHEVRAVLRKQYCDWAARRADDSGRHRDSVFRSENGPYRSEFHSTVF